MWDSRRMLLNQESSEKATAPAVAFIGSIIFVVGKSPVDIMEPILL